MIVHRKRKILQKITTELCFRTFSSFHHKFGASLNVKADTIEEKKIESHRKTE